MRIFVINRPKDPERRANSITRLAAAGVPFEFFDGIDGDTAIGTGHFKGYDEDEFVLNTGRRPTPGEIGCFASHRALWARAVELDEAVMIMEDDFDLRGDFAGAVACAGELVGTLGFLRLQKDWKARKTPVERRDGFTACRYTKPPHCTMCYCVAPAVARKLLANSRNFDAPVDVFLKKYWDHGQALHALLPYTVVPIVAGPASTIGRRVKLKKPLGLGARRFLRKVGWHCRRLRFNARARRGCL